MRLKIIVRTAGLMQVAGLLPFIARAVAGLEKNRETLAASVRAARTH